MRIINVLLSHQRQHHRHVKNLASLIKEIFLKRLSLYYCFTLAMTIRYLLKHITKWYLYICKNNDIHLIKKRNYFSAINQNVSFLLSIDLSIPIYHSMNTENIGKPLRPMYASHNLLIIYIFLPISDNIIVIIMGLMTTSLYIIVMIFVSYASEEMIVTKVLSEFFFFLCINFVGMFFRLTNEIDIRKTFIDRRECVQKNLQLKFERDQEVGK